MTFDPPVTIWWYNKSTIQLTLALVSEEERKIRCFITKEEEKRLREKKWDVLSLKERVINI